MSKRIYFILLVCIVLLLVSSPVYAIGRNVTLEADGYIELHSVTGNTTSKAGLQIKGEGKITYQGEGSLSGTNIAQAYRVEAKSAENTLRPLTIISALQVGNGDGAAYSYALMVAPAKGETGLLDVLYEANTEGFATLYLSATAMVSQGEFRNYAYIKNESFFLEEEIRALGFVNFSDLLKISSPNNAE